MVKYLYAFIEENKALPESVNITRFSSLVKPS